MKRPPALVIALFATAAMLDCGNAHAQARGPSADEIKEAGQRFESNYIPPTQMENGWRLLPKGEPVPSMEFSAMGPAGALDDASRAAKLAELQTWLGRLPGRYRIDGRVEGPGVVHIEGAPEPIPVKLEGDISGITDCAALGDGVGVKCILNASWKIIEWDVLEVTDPSTGKAPVPPDSEMLNTMQPAVLLLGLNLDPPAIRSMLVMDDSIAHIWAGPLAGNILTADRLTDCKDEIPPEPRCLQPFKIVAEPDSEVVTIVLRKFYPDNLPLKPYRPLGIPETFTVTITMYRDPEAKLEKPMKTKKAR